MVADFSSGPISSSVIRAWQTLRFVPNPIFCCLIAATVFVSKVDGQLYDSLDAHPPRWVLDTSDCDARIIEHKHLPDGGIDGRACETITFNASHGTEAIFAYPIEPVQPIDALNASVHVMSARSGIRIGFRIRYPYARDKETRRPIATTIYGSSHNEPGYFRRLGVGAIEKQLRLKTIAVRQEQGIGADLSDPYVDAVIINAYTGTGATSLKIDELNVVGLVPIGETGHVPSKDEAEFSAAISKRVPQDNDGRVPGGTFPNKVQAFPVGKITKILQHNGEPFRWVKSLGFDAVLLARPPTADILREAIQSRVLIYAPPPTAPNPQLKSLLEPVAAWYIGTGVSLDRRRIQQAAVTSRRLKTFPLRWQRPVIAAPSESWRDYSSIVDAMIDDLPLRSRGITPGEEVAEMLRTQQQMGSHSQTAVGIASMPAERTLQQADAVARSIGAPVPGDFRWHSMWLQAMRSLESTPSAILYRSSRSLVSGNEMSSQRAMALSYVNRMIAMIAPWISGATPAPPPRIVGAPYRCGRLQTGETDVLLLTSTALRGNETLAGDGSALEILLPPEDVAKTAWRLTHFTAERISTDSTPTGSQIQIVSPDAAEIVVISSDPTVGGRLAETARLFARQAGSDRWQLTSDLVQRTRQDWEAAVAARTTNQPMPTDLISVARRTLADAEPLYRAGDVGASLRMARRADAWALRSQWQLCEELMPDWPNPTSCPPMDCGAIPVQISWSPLLQNEGWGKNRLTTGSLDREDVFGEGRWTFGRRIESSSTSEISMLRRGSYRGPGALRTTVVSTSDDALPGGYEGTAVQISSPSVRIPSGKAYRIEALVRTLGFGEPHQGVLVYDNVGGQEMGVLVRGASTWQTVRLYRQTTREQEVNVMFEMIGAGEATIDEVRLNVWEPKPRPFLPICPIAELPEQSGAKRR